MTDIARFTEYVGDEATLERLTSTTPSRLRRDWFSELIRWHRERGIKSFTAIAAYLGINRTTLWRWEHGTPPTSAHIAMIMAKTFGDVDPRRPAPHGARNIDVLRKQTTKAISQSQEMAAMSRAQTEAAQQINTRLRINLDESRLTLGRLARNGGK